MSRQEGEEGNSCNLSLVSINLNFNLSHLPCSLSLTLPSCILAEHEEELIMMEEKNWLGIWEGSLLRKQGKG